VQQTSDRYDPESRVVRSTQSREEQAQSDQAAQDGAVSVGSQLPGGNAAAANQQPGANRDSNRKSEETVNYEISRTTRTEVIEPGRVKRLSVAVLVDGSYARPQGSNEATYTPRPQEELDRITALVRSAIGFDEKRGDHVEVVNLRFAEVAGTPQIIEDGGFLSKLRFTTDDIMHAVNLAVVAILGLLVLLLVVRPLIRRVVTPDESVTPALAPALPGSLSEGTAGGPNIVAGAGRSAPAVDPEGRRTRFAQSL
jgi:flagellar M-ring protein FliF